eukprot:3491383-Rhodomonas_salina.1
MHYGTRMVLLVGRRCSRVHKAGKRVAGGRSSPLTGPAAERECRGEREGGREGEEERERERKIQTQGRRSGEEKDRRSGVGGGEEEE